MRYFICPFVGLLLLSIQYLLMLYLLFAAKEEKVMIGATIDLLKIMAELKLTEREIALLNAVVLFQPGKLIDLLVPHPSSSHPPSHIPPSHIPTILHV